MKKAFTLLELVFVIVIIGILVTQFFHTSNNNKLRLAANQLISHIRYTQHLAMMDDVYNANDEFWYKKRWNLRIVDDLTYTSLNCPNDTYSSIWSYSIYQNLSCDSLNCNTNTNISELARNPLNKNQVFSGGLENELCIDNKNNDSDKQSMKELRLGEKYGIKDIDFSGGCRSTTTYIHFDYLGRPLNGYPINGLAYQESGSWKRLLDQDCNITLCTHTPCLDALNSEKIVITIEPETGYSYLSVF